MWRQSRNWFYLCAALGAVMIMGWSLRAQDVTSAGTTVASAPASAGDSADQPVKKIIRIYNTADLIDPPDATPQKSGVPPTRLYESRETKAREDEGIPCDASMTAGKLSGMIERLFETDEPLVRVTLEGRLVIEGTARQQAKIEDFLALLRKERAGRRMISLQAWWVVLDGQQAVKAFGQSPAPLAEVAPEVLSSLEGDAVSGSVAGFESQPLRLAAGLCQTVVTDGSPVVSENATAIDPMIQIVQWGPVLEVVPLVADSGTSATVHIRSIITEPGEKTLKRERPAAPPLSTTMPSTAGFLREVDRLDFMAYSLNTSLRMPLGRPVLVGSMSKAPGKRIYFVLQLKVSKS